MVDGLYDDKPGVSAMRFAALPVGAHNLIFFPRAFKAPTNPWTIVVLPAPGPPVTIDIALDDASLIAAICSSERENPPLTPSSKFSISALFSVLAFFAIRAHSLATFSSLACDSMVETTSLFLRCA